MFIREVELRSTCSRVGSRTSSAPSASHGLIMTNAIGSPLNDETVEPKLYRPPLGRGQGAHLIDRLFGAPTGGRRNSSRSQRTLDSGASHFQRLFLTSHLICLVDIDVLSEFRTRNRNPNSVAWFGAVASTDRLVCMMTIGEIELGIELRRTINPGFVRALVDWLDVTLRAYGERVPPLTIAIASHRGRQQHNSATSLISQSPRRPGSIKTASIPASTRSAAVELPMASAPSTATLVISAPPGPIYHFGRA